MMTLRGVVRKALSMGVAAAFATMLALALTPSKAAASACALSIPTCGCTISSPGTYTLTGASPMNSTGTCIDIAASGVTLNGAGMVIKGPGPATATLGVLIESTANKAILEDIIIEDFAHGVHANGPNFSTLDVITAFNNKGTVVNGANAFLLVEESELDNLAGIQVNASATDFVMVAGVAIEDTGVGIWLNGVSGAFIDEAEAEGNGSLGIWLKGASNNVIDGFISESNGIAGVYLGSNPLGPNGMTCSPGACSNGNSLIGSIYGGKSSVVSNTGSPQNQRYGVAVDPGNLHNHFLDITGTGNVLEDASDGNGCGSNRWFDDTFTKSSPPKNTSFFCLN